MCVFDIHVTRVDAIEAIKILKKFILKIKVLKKF